MLNGLGRGGRSGGKIRGLSGRDTVPTAGAAFNLEKATIELNYAKNPRLLELHDLVLLDEIGGDLYA